MELAPANTNPFETNRLLQELSACYGETPWMRRHSERVKEVAIKVISGETQGALWFKQPDLAAGVAILDRVDGMGMRAFYLYAERDHQNPGSLRDFVSGLNAYSLEHGGLFAVSNAIPGISHGDQSSILGPMGYVHVGRKAMRFDITAATPPEEAPLPYGRQVAVGIHRIEELVNLYALSYAHHRDQLFSEMPKDPKGTGRSYLEDFFLDVDIPITAWGSFGVEHEGRLVAAILVRDEYRAPQDSRKRWIYDLMVDPEHRGKGIGRYLLSRLVREARDRGVTELDLEVTEGNPAEKIYAGLGFVPFPDGEGDARGLWVRASSLGPLGIDVSGTP